MNRFLAYSTKDKDFNIRFENKEEPVKISDILKNSSEGKVYHISLGEDNQITASKKNGNERHYNFTGSGSCEMTINWQAKDSKGNSIGCSMTVKVGLSVILEVIGEPEFGNLKFTDSLSEEEGSEILELVKQNKEVFINGKTLYQAFTSMMDKNVSNQPMREEGIFIQNPPESPQSPTLDSSGYSSLETPILSTDDEELEREEGGLGDEIERLKSEIKELEEKNEHLEKENAELKDRNKKIVEEGDRKEKELTEEKQALEKEIIELKAKLERKIKELDSKNQDIEQLKQQIGVLEQSQRDKNARIEDLKSQLADKKGKAQSADKTNEELRKEFEQNEAELNKLRTENTALKKKLEKIVEGLAENDKEKQLAEQLMKAKKENETLTDKVSRLAEELNQLQKEALERKT